MHSVRKAEDRQPTKAGIDSAFFCYENIRRKYAAGFHWQSMGKRGISIDGDKHKYEKVYLCEFTYKIRVTKLTNYAII